MLNKFDFEESPMNYKITFFVLAVLAVFAFASVPRAATIRDDAGTTFQNLPLKDTGPSFSSPQETVEPNGDLSSHYPPYYRSEGDGA